MTQWEYRTIPITTWKQGTDEIVIFFDGKEVGNVSLFGKAKGYPLTKYYNELGEQGWELIDLRSDSSSSPVNYTATFKRVKKS